MRPPFPQFRQPRDIERDLCRPEPHLAAKPQAAAVPDSAAPAGRERATIVFTM
jgi:hypothetical protein